MQRRIAHAQFTLNGKVISLTPNQRGLAVHGDPDGFDKRVWQRRDFVDEQSLGSVFHLVSPDGDQGMPGELDVSVTYRLLHASNEFRIEYNARSTAPTVINLTNHAYFNLAGAGSPGLASHIFQIRADRYAETDDKRVPTGNLLSVQDTALDFRQPTGISQRLVQAANELGKPPGYDHSLVFSDWNGQLELVANIVESHSGRHMQVLTTEPSVQFFSGNGFDGSEIASEGKPYQRHDGFAFETQHLPDSPNHASFPTTLLSPGQVFNSVTSFRFSISPHLKR
ncbi:aldose epimerase family protein [Undibacterium sp. TJN19]|uniref:aldose epimerase family protein n=1 Tax=Undibacterium sp. TJN19 TaxID=3413055 RepID=UPI003BF2AE3B